jgi:tetratricopeptide (TPR) repeat protein/O-antigen ligase
MTTKLSRFSDGLIESLWLAAVIIVPLFFNVFSSRIFEPDKIAILRTLSLAILGAWLIKIVEQWDVDWETIKKSDSPVKSLLKIPLIAPVLGLAVVYLIATILSVSPSASFWGSYQRLQGTYTTLSYLVIFAAVAGNLRSRDQVNRLITVVVVTSLPIALYGVLQRYGLDPVPWQGDVSVRIASTLGNSIFVAAYLIMVFPLTMGRIVTHFRSIVDNDEDRVIIHMVSATGYVFIAALQVIALYLSGSRGPAMGWLASTFILGLLLILLLRKRWLIVSVAVASLLLAGFLFVFNLEDSPLESLRNSSTIGRFGMLLDPDSNSALVRNYIWEGAADLVAPHEPLKFPDGRSDRFNIIRPIVGYGPESMFVAFNQFYIPELGQVERRNASPDRSHNETWDALVTTGILGLFAYVMLFTAIFYYALKWLGYIVDNKHRVLFYLIYFSGGVIGAVGLSLWRGIPYGGVGLPFGLMLGLIVYLIIVSLLQRYEKQETEDQITRYIILSVLFSAILAHFIEINFGIAIVATRTYFWIYAGMLLAAGYILPNMGVYELINNAEQRIGQAKLQSRTTNKRGKQGGEKTISRGQKTKRGKRGTYIPSQNWMSEALLPGLLAAIILVTLGYDLIGNPGGLSNGFEILWASLTRLESGASSGILLMMITTWIVCSVLLTFEMSRYHRTDTELTNNIWKSTLVVLGVSALLGVVYWLWHTSSLASLTISSSSTLQGLIASVARYENVLTKYFVYWFLLVVGVAFLLAKGRTAARKVLSMWTTRGAIASLIVLPIILWMSLYSNLQVIQADIAFRIAASFAKPNQWPVAVEVYKRANELAPGEDFYYLSLAGAYFEQAKSIEDPLERDQMMMRAEEDLLLAQEINPLNTDHTGNLARLYNLWSTYAENSRLREERLQKSYSYYSTAVKLSPNNSRIWDEWALLHLTGLNKPEEAYRILNHAIEIDPDYDWTHGLLGDYYVWAANQNDDPEEARLLLIKAAEEYTTAIGLVKYYEAQNRLGYIMALAKTYERLSDIKQAIGTYELALIYVNSEAIWRIEETLARWYYQIEDIESALIHARKAYLVAPEDEKVLLEELILQLDGKLE